MTNTANGSKAHEVPMSLSARGANWLGWPLAPREAVEEANKRAGDHFGIRAGMGVVRRHEPAVPAFPQAMCARRPQLTLEQRRGPCRDGHRVAPIAPASSTGSKGGPLTPIKTHAIPYQPRQAPMARAVTGANQRRKSPAQITGAGEGTAVFVGSTVAGVV